MQDTALRPLPYRPASALSISQSLVKELRRDVCPRRLYGMYALGLPTAPNDSQLRGIYFEYKLTGSCGRPGVPPQEPLQRNGKRYVDFERLDQQAEFVRKELFPHYGIELLDTDVLVAAEFGHPDTGEAVRVKCRLDAIGRVNGKLAVIDIKATADLANGGWRNPLGLDHTQAYFYMWALHQSQTLNPEGVMPDFYYVVADWSPRMDYEIIQVEWNQGNFWDVRHTATEAHDRLRQLEEEQFPTRPSFQQCQQCPFGNECTDRRVFKEVKVVW